MKYLSPKIFLPQMTVGLAASAPPLNRFPALFLRAKSMAAATSSGNLGISYTTLRERVRFEREIKRSKFIAIAAPISDDQSALAFLSQVGNQYRSNDDGEPSGTAGRPIYSAIASSGIDRVMVVVIRYFGGIKLGTGGLVRAYGGVASECLRDAPTCLVKSKVIMGLEVPFDLLGSVYHQLQSFQVEDIKQEYDTGNEGTTIITFKVDYDQVDNLEDTIKAACSRQIKFSKH